MSSDQEQGLRILDNALWRIAYRSDCEYSAVPAGSPRKPCDCPHCIAQSALEAYAELCNRRQDREVKISSPLTPLMPRTPLTGGYHFFVARNGGEWHRTETKGVAGDRPVECACGVSNQDPRLLKHGGHDDESWKSAPAKQLGACFSQYMRKESA
jgi:hypothetical protein